MQSFNDEEIEASMEERRARLDSVKANILIAQQKQKKNYDRKHFGVCHWCSCVEERPHPKETCWREIGEQVARSVQDYRKSSNYSATLI